MDSNNIMPENSPEQRSLSVLHEGLPPLLGWSVGARVRCLVNNRGVPEDFPGRQERAAEAMLFPNRGRVRSTLFLGEEASGRSRCARALREQSRSDGMWYFVVNLRSNEKAEVFSLAETTAHRVGAVQGWFSQFQQGMLTDTSGEMLLQTMAANERLVAIVRKFDLLDAKKARELSVRFASWIESYCPTSIHFLFPLRDLRVHRMDSVGSGLAVVSQQFRIEPWNALDVATVASWYQSGANHVGPDAVLLYADSVSREIATVCGGQPAIIHEFLRRLRVLTVDGKRTAANPRLFSTVVDSLASRPPPIVDRWRQHLRDLLEGNRALVRPLRGYVGGERHTRAMTNRFPPPEAEHDLYFAGWLGMDADDLSWGIRSELHQSWAHEVLETFR